MTLTAQKPVALVAGGGGFVGSHLCDALLDRGMEVICLDDFSTGRRENIRPLANSPRFALIEASVTDLPPLALPRLDWVFNLASPASPRRYQQDPVRTVMINVLGTHHLLEVARKHQARFLQASTSEVYGDPEQHPQDENYLGHVNPMGPRACYDEGKRVAETLCADYMRAGSAQVRVARIFNTYGPRMCADDGRIVSNLISQALGNAPLTIYGDGTQTRSFCYVSDLVRGLVALMAHEGALPGPVNLGNPSEITILELADIVRKVTGSRSEVVLRPLPEDDPKRRRPSIDRARDLLGWAPVVPLRDGLAETAAWFSAQRLPGTRSGEGEVARAAE
ncbi:MULTISPECIES: UDP-glucuronic acid decarboxylase family protein [unclassified Salipiger]|uniref:UDP-glucuronic acid decarboxylase family protein n=1 Tax=unclassified Salipiger TaxID=2640570 RepID=UPI0013B69D6C|nr:MULTISPECIES: UDP-glucuronic acid decarboxylase family protein [unclassified Salipiger]NDV49289.1 SDR family oxidoreductase [Salipiger sp. PrR003]NDW32762.1 SDR family oxidoreductase [Salipiger sp. PrR007]